ncbi:hypothetical protein L6164_019510 [Bauhinia variegata]|uniref:Uncharacterized protein n=1 Tax=Bauhinia variegata TaxID=167791 RepID=A0ACB9MTY9_BAUVA|nr:hypothetical protein L6164_019510 [Bauhinia variegata]
MLLSEAATWFILSCYRVEERLHLEVEENSTSKMQPVIMVNKSAAYVVYDLTYIRFTHLAFWLNMPTFEGLTQFGVVTISTKNTDEVEASYSLTVYCFSTFPIILLVIWSQEQFLIMKPNEIETRSFKINPTTDQAAKYLCTAILKDSDYNEVDRAGCQFSTTQLGSQGMPFQPPETSVNGFF